jgi:hypothetical protein
MNCLATIIQSLRDKDSQHLPTNSMQITPQLEHEHSDSTELAEVLPDVAFALVAGSSVASEVGSTSTIREVGPISATVIAYHNTELAAPSFCWQ